MNAKTPIIVTILALSLLTSCREQKDTEKEAEAEVKIEQVEEQPEIDVDEKRRLDSIRQVKDHGHAH
jgi:hypothetical protein